MKTYIIVLLSEALSSYALTFLIASSSLFARFRWYFKARTKWLQVDGYKHFADCRMCISFWTSLACCLVYGNVTDTLVVYGASYWLATQERN